ncbi:GxxExxY protein [candidate division BRC1 bacterium SM23_51]|nr:MAG: GxxExxY protein [candidate division BRC1 bacterium SM23_51]
MNRQDARNAKKREPSEELDCLARAVIGAAIEVHRVLGPGYLESVYEQALCVELDLRGVPYSRQSEVGIDYKGKIVGESKLDLLVGDAIVVELKAVEQLAPVHSAQVISYLKATGLQLGLLVNFNVPVLKDGLKRIILS